MKAEDVTAIITAELEKGIVPWRRPWNVGGLVPTSLATGKHYRGVNALLLSIYGAAAGYERNLWTTYKQAQALGGQVRKGEKGSPVVFWSKVEGKPDETGKERDYMIMRSFTVFNVAQCDDLNIPARFLPVARSWSDDEAVDRLWEGYAGRPALIHAEQGRAFYSPSVDTITLPPKHAFPTLADYAETLFHEATHSTGHASRLDRFAENEGPVSFGSPNYAREELVAELGAAMLVSHAGLKIDATNSAAYVGGWLEALENDKRLIITAAQRAAKAVAMITGETMPVEESVPAIAA